MLQIIIQRKAIHARVPLKFALIHSVLILSVLRFILLYACSTFHIIIWCENIRLTRNSSGYDIANVNFLYDDIVHALKIQYTFA